MLKVLLLLIGIAGLGALGMAIKERLDAPAKTTKKASESRPTPVEIGPIVRSDIVLQRTFSGALESPAEFVVAPKVSGRVKRLDIDLGDPVRRGQEVAWLEDDEFVQAELQAAADLAVANANVAQATSALDNERRSLERAETLHEKGVTAESRRDEVKATELAAKARLAVAEAQVLRAKAALETSTIKRGYTRISATWSSGDEERFVGQRFVDEGETVSANTPILSIIELNPMLAVIYVPERDYSRLKVGQAATLLTDAFPGQPFPARVSRIAPVFRRATRQARLELTVQNDDHRLKPGMFIRATVALDESKDAVVVPEEALAERGTEIGVFVLDDLKTDAVAAGAEKNPVRTVRWVPVRTGIRNGGRVELLDPLSGEVVTLGHQLLAHGARVVVFTSTAERDLER